MIDLLNKVYKQLQTRELVGDCKPAWTNDTLPSEKDIGAFIHLQCGHNGFMSHSEREMLYTLATRAKFID